MRCVLVTALNICVGGLSPRLIALEIPVLLFFLCIFAYSCRLHGFFIICCFTQSKSYILGLIVGVPAI